MQTVYTSIVALKEDGREAKLRNGPSMPMVNTVRPTVPKCCKAIVLAPIKASITHIPRFFSLPVTQSRQSSAHCAPDALIVV